MTALNVKFIMAHNFSILMDVLIVEGRKELTAEYNEYDNKKAQIHAGFWLGKNGKGLMGLEARRNLCIFYTIIFYASPAAPHLIPSQLSFLLRAIILDRL
jgi:hypothetical protein